MLYRKGKITRSQLEDYNKGLSGAKYQALPQHVKKVKATARAAKLKVKSGKASPQARAAKTKRRA